MFKKYQNDNLGIRIEIVFIYKVNFITRYKAFEFLIFYEKR